MDKVVNPCALSLVRAGINRCFSATEVADGLADVLFDIHPGDQMFTHSLAAHGDQGAALTQYFNVGLQQFRCFEHVRRWVCGDNSRTCRILDFACGFGRSLRFAAVLKSRPMIWGSEIQAEALAFVHDRFAVPTLLSHADPTRFDSAERFNIIWVASLFTHLPEPLFFEWLRKLLSLLSPDGLLCFSARDEELLSDQKRLGATGFLYESQSENAALSSDIYGTAYVNESYIEDCCRRATGSQASYLRIPRLLAMEQDLYCVSRTSRNLGTLNTIQRGCWGWLDIRMLSIGGHLHLEGWAASMPDGPADFVEILVGGERFVVTPHIDRPDVAGVFANPSLMQSGWRFERQMNAGMREVPVIVLAHAGRDAPSALLYAGLLRAP